MIWVKWNVTFGNTPTKHKEELLNIISINHQQDLAYETNSFNVHPPDS
jgi:hypothetical protein